MRTRRFIISLLLTAAPWSALAQSAPRTIPPDSMWRLVWIVGRDDTEGTFVEPRHVVVSGSLVVVLDMGTREVRGFDAAKGRPRFVLVARGEGPGEFRRPAKLAAIPNGFAVLDHATARLTGFDRSGRYQWDLNIPEVFNVTGICISKRNTVFVSYARRDSSIVQYDTSGRRLGSLQLPWTVARATTVSFAHESRVSAPNAAGDCVVAPMFGREWAVFSTGESPRARVFLYREAGKEPIMQSTTRTLERTGSSLLKEQTNTTNTDPIANGAIVRGDTSIVLTYNSRRQSFSLLDFYVGDRGRYAYSRNLPVSFTSLAVDSNGTYYGTLITAKEQALVAMRPERLPATTRTKGTATPGPSRPAGTPGRRPAPAPAPPPTRH